MTAGEMQADAGEEFTHPATDLEQAQAQGVELERRIALRGEPAAQRIEQPVGGGMEQQPELVGPEAAITEAIGDAGALEVFDPQFGCAAINIPIVEGRR